eukprot:TCALIF_04654-PA protein Name:"Protein of unknown function" AED:0.29 eAED:0.29 QI:38/0.5/0/0.66/0/0.33/3/0/467
MLNDSQSCSRDSTDQTLERNAHWSTIEPLAPLESGTTLIKGCLSGKPTMRHHPNQRYHLRQSISNSWLVISLWILQALWSSPAEAISALTHTLENGNLAGGLLPSLGQNDFHAISSRSVEDYSPLSASSLDQSGMHRQDRNHYFRSVRIPSDHYFRSLRSPSDHYFRSMRDPSDHYFRSLRSPNDHYFRSLRDVSDHYFRSMRSPNNHYFRSMRANPEPNDHYFRSLRSNPSVEIRSPNDHYFRSLRTPQDHYFRSMRNPQDHYFRSMRTPQDHYFRSMRTPQDHYFRSLRSKSETRTGEGEEPLEDPKIAEEDSLQKDQKPEVQQDPQNHYFRSLRQSLGFQREYQRAIKAGTQNHYFRSMRKRSDGEKPNGPLSFKRLTGESSTPKALDHYFRSLRSQAPTRDDPFVQDNTSSPLEDDPSYLNQLLIQSVLDGKPYQGVEIPFSLTNMSGNNDDHSVVEPSEADH